MVGGILIASGVPGFLENSEELYVNSNPEEHEWKEFVDAWWKEYQDKWTKPRDLCISASVGDFLATCLGDGNERSRQIRLGRRLAAKRDTFVSGFKVERQREGLGTYYRLNKVK